MREPGSRRVIRRGGADETEGVAHSEAIPERIRLRRVPQIFQHSLPLEVRRLKTEQRIQRAQQSVSQPSMAADSVMRRAVGEKAPDGGAGARPSLLRYPQARLALQQRRYSRAAPAGH